MSWRKTDFLFTLFVVVATEETDAEELHRVLSVSFSCSSLSSFDWLSSYMSSTALATSSAVFRIMTSERRLLMTSSLALLSLSPGSLLVPCTSFPIAEFPAWSSGDPVLRGE